MTTSEAQEHVVKLNSIRTKAGYWHTAICSCGWKTGADNFAVVQTQAADHDRPMPVSPRMGSRP